MQIDSKDCGLYCLESFFEYYYSDEISVADLKSKATYGPHGINILELNKIANTIGLHIEPFKLNSEELFAYKNKNPFMVLIKESGFTHYVIIYKKNNKTITILDPAKGKYKISKKEFETIFLGVLLLVDKTTKKWIKKTDNTLFEYIWHEKKFIFLIIFLLIVISIANIISAYFLKLFVDKVLPSHANKLLNLLFIFFAWLVIVKLSSAFWSSYIKNKLFLSKKIELRNKIIQIFQNGSLKSINKLSTIDWFRRLDMVDASVNYFAQIVSTVTKDVIIIFISLIFLLSINSQLIYICIGSCLLLFILSLIFKKNKTKLIPKLIDSNLKLNLNYFDILNRHLELKDIDNAQFLLNKNNSLLRKTTLRELAIKDINNWNNFINEFILQISYILIIFLGGRQVIQNKLTIGNLLLFISMFSLFSNSFNNINNTFLEWTEMKKNISLVNFVLKIPREEINENGIKIQKIKKIEINNLSHTYELGKRILNIKKLKIMKNMNIIGENGIGKTTFLRILYSYLDYNGQIIINDIDLKEIDKSFLRKQIFISGNNWLPNIPLKKFLTNNEEEVALLNDNLKKYGISNILFKNNIEITQDIINNGNNFSTGQKRIISLLPLFSRHYSLILLDEVFENIDKNNRKKISYAIKHFQKSAIILNVSHNKENIFKFKKEYKIEK